MTQPLLCIKRELCASPPEVFLALSKPELISKWVLPFQNWKASGKSDFKVGGIYTLDLIDIDGTVHHHTGKYLEIILNEKIVFTWNTLDNSETLVTLTVREIGERKTEVVLTHELFPNEETRTRYLDGWQNCFARLEELLLVKQP